MQEFINAFHFLRPWWLLLLVIPLFFYGRYLRGASNQSSWEKVCDKRLLDYLLIRGSSTQRKVMAWTALIGLVTGIVAAAGPSWKKIEIPSLAPENPLMIVLNLSTDMKGKDLTPSRLERAKFKIQDLLKLIPDSQSGLIVYTNEPFLISPLTSDGEILTNLLPAVSYDIMPANGDRPDRAIALAVEKMKAAGFNHGEILLLAPEAGQKFNLTLDEARKALSAGFNVNVLAVRAAKDERLQMIAEAGGGSYWNLAPGDEKLKTFAEKISSNQDELTESKNWQSVWLDYGYYLLIIPLACCLYFFRRGILAVVFLWAAQPAEAAFFLNSNQEALRDFNQEDYQRAGEKFTDSNWKAAAYYRMGDYDKALEEYSKGQGETALYNQGNALAKSGKIEEAIAKYEEVLEQNPNHEDAKFNLEYLKQQQQQSQQQNQQQQQNQNQDERQKESQQDQSNGGDNEQKEQPQDNSESNQPQNQNQNEDGAEQNNPDQNDNSKADANGQQEQERQQDPQDNDQNSASDSELKQGEQNKERPQQQGESGALQKEGKAPKYDEEVQARAQQYREIPEDPGGLLKAFIRKEYNRNRYNEK